MCKEIICRKKFIIFFVKKSYLEQLKIFYLKNSNLKTFSVFLVEVLKIVSADQNKNINVLSKKEFQS